MFPNVVSHTSLLTAAARAAESRRPQRLFDDPHAEALAGAGGAALLAEVGEETAVPSIAIRTRYFDDFVVAAVARGIRRVVMLGAGLDARAYRLGLPATVRWLEVDLAPVLAYKRGVLAGLDGGHPHTPGAAPTVELHDVPGDASEQQTFDALRAAGLDPGDRALWVVEGLICFLHADEIKTLFERMARASAPDSEVLFDIPNMACVDALGEFARAGSALNKRGLKSGTDDPIAFARSLGVSASAVNEGHPAAHFGRRPEPPSATVTPGSWTLYLVHGHFEGAAR